MARQKLLESGKAKPKPIFKIQCAPGSVVPKCVDINAQKSEAESQAMETNLNETQLDQTIENQTEVDQKEVEPVNPNKIIWIGENPFELGSSPETDKELRQLKKIVQAEQGHGQWTKQLFNTVLLIALVGMNLCLPTKTRPSAIGILKCTW